MPTQNQVIFKRNINTTPPQPLTPQQQLQSDNFVQQINAQYQQNVRVAGALAKFIWGDPAQAQSKFNLFGANAADLLKVSAAFVGTYEGTAPTIIPPGYSVVGNSDGSVTVTGPASSSEPVSVKK